MRADVALREQMLGEISLHEGRERDHGFGWVREKTD